LNEVFRFIWFQTKRSHHVPPPQGPEITDPVLSQILTGNQLRWLLFTFLALTVLALFLGILLPGTLLVNPYGRFFLLVLVAFSMGVCLFLLFPAHFELTKIPGLDLGIKVVGPVVLVVFMLLLLNKYMPVPSGGKLFLKNGDSSSPIAKLPPALIRFDPSTGQGISNIHMLVKMTDPYNPDTLAGFYIEYVPDQAPKQFTTTVKVQNQVWGKATFDFVSAGTGVVHWEFAKKAVPAEVGGKQC